VFLARHEGGPVAAHVFAGAQGLYEAYLLNVLGTLGAAKARIVSFRART
jgi:hypothetical protein